ncbi:FG-GAP-like repeat-containing protein [Maribacter aestuarii]|uniref:FG-GAP-like repeat-containing protein n=1 Tax=Maribacter aestuarii TaxID=1130723 RepID=UPI0025A52B29|nr:FG-GAP-like repeat-containing protein [Maribacter aestuarii]
MKAAGFYNAALTPSELTAIYNEFNNINTGGNGAIGKFLNGNLPVGTPDDVSGPFAPALLSETGAFSDLAALTASDGVVPYEMVEPFWSDGASKSRWMAVPNDGTHDTAEEQIVFSDTDAWDFPRGSVLIKHFELGGKRLETRFEVKGDDDVYYYLTYKWNAAQTDAELLVGSLDEDVDVDGTVQSWHYPSRAECVACHFPQNGSVLGPKTRNLNKTITYPGGVSANQLANLSEMGIIAENITEANAGNYMAVAAKDDLSRSLEDRARSYIDVNCASCHNPTVDNIAQFDARYTTPLVDQNIVYGDVAYDLGLPDGKVVVPQQTGSSLMHHRMNSLQQNVEMPPIAKDVVDAAGVQLIADWINSLTPIANNPPQAVITASVTNGTAPLPVDFDASASSDADGDALTYDWDLGDGTTAQGETVAHTYDAPGDYTVTLTVDDGQDTGEDTTVITVSMSTDASAVAFTEATSLLQGDNYSGLVMAVADMNGDGRDDIVQLDNGRNLSVQYQNAPGQPFDKYNFGPVPNILNDGRIQWSVTVADMDHNGYNDILSGGYYDGVKVIANNNGNDSYTSQYLPGPLLFIQGSNFADIDNDGWADIFACNDDAESNIYINDRDGTFSVNETILDTETVPASDNSGNYASMWVDYDNDRHLDLYISKCRGGVTDPTDPRRINMLMRNNGDGTFTEDAAAANLKNGEQTWLTDFGDIDNDGDMDAIIINHGSGPNLMRNNGNGTFTEVTASSGLLPTLAPENLYGVQGFFKDFNNDGFLDLMVSGDNHFLFYNNGNGTFALADNPFNSNTVQSFTVGDLNHDGFLDIYAGYATGLNTPTTVKDRLWLNQGNANNFLNVQLTGVQSNVNGIGARVELHGPWGTQIREVRSGEGYGVFNSFTQHFGIGSATTIDRIVVRWPSGIVDEVTAPNPNQFVTITEGADNCPDSDNDGVCDDDDICPLGDDSIDVDANGIPDACEGCPATNFNDYQITAFPGQDNGTYALQDGGSTIYMTGNA